MVTSAIKIGQAFAKQEYFEIKKEEFDALAAQKWLRSGDVTRFSIVMTASIGICIFIRF